MYDDQRSYAFDQLMWTSQILHDMGHDAQALLALRGALRRLEDGADYQGRGQKALELSRALARALVREGEIVAADIVLRDASNKHSLPAQDAALCVAWSGLKSCQGPFWAIPPTFLSGPAAAGGIALINSVPNLGGQVGPWLVGVLRKHSGGFSAGLLLSSGLLLAAGLLALTLRPPPRPATA